MTAMEAYYNSPKLTQWQITAPNFSTNQPTSLISGLSTMPSVIPSTESRLQGLIREYGSTNPNIPVEASRMPSEALYYGNVTPNMDNTQMQLTEASRALNAYKDGRTFGWLSRMSETGSEVGKHNTWNKRDGGGQSLGIYQLHSKYSMNDFMNSLKKNNPDLYAKLSPGYTYKASRFSPEFIQAWKDNEQALVPIQHEFAKEHFYTPNLKRLTPEMRARVEADPRLQEALFSFSVNGSQESFNPKRNSALANLDKMTTDDIINAVYDYRTTPDNYYKKFTPRERIGIYTNINNERKRLLNWKY
ncbi:MAG: hypothetical protein HUJ56_12700 [Erysipelotrichaceae bacterium]|nr:hypothetical protein [Erysipelotrichaceae bacterium]